MAEQPNKTYHVAVGGPVGSGRYAIRTIIDRPNLELAKTSAPWRASTR